MLDLRLPGGFNAAVNSRITFASFCLAMTFPILRVARPTDNLPALLRFYCDGLGLQQLAAFHGQGRRP